MKGLRLIGGDRNAASKGNHSLLMLTVSDRARAAGLKVLGVTASRHFNSTSRYLRLEDARGRFWRIRISNHHAPERAPDNHFDLVSFDGIFGRSQLVEYVDRIAEGSADWFDVEGTGHRMSNKDYRKLRKRSR